MGRWRVPKPHRARGPRNLTPPNASKRPRTTAAPPNPANNTLAMLLAPEDTHTHTQAKFQKPSPKSKKKTRKHDPRNPEHLPSRSPRLETCLLALQRPRGRRPFSFASLRVAGWGSGFLPPLILIGITLSLTRSLEIRTTCVFIGFLLVPINFSRSSLHFQRIPIHLQKGSYDC